MFGGKLAARCPLTNPVQVRDMAAVLFDGQCAQVGGEWTMRLLILRPPDGGIDIRISDPRAGDWDWQWYVRDLLPCP